MLSGDDKAFKDAVRRGELFIESAAVFTEELEAQRLYQLSRLPAQMEENKNKAKAKGKGKAVKENFTGRTHTLVEGSYGSQYPN